MTTAALTTDPAYQGDVRVRGPLPEIESSGIATYPPLARLSKPAENRLREYINAELEAFFVERQQLLEDWKAWQTLYWAKPGSKQRNFPFKRSANIVVPLAAIAVEAIHARVMNTLFAVEPFWSIRPRSRAWVEAAKPMERWLQSEVESRDALDMFKFCNEALLELYKLGTAVAKSGYERDIRKSLRRVGGRDEEFYSVVKNSATVDRVPLVNFIMRFAELDPQTAPLVGEKHTDITWSQLKALAQNGRMFPEVIEEIRTAWTEHGHSEEAGDGADYDSHTRRLSETEPIWFSKFDFYELWLSFDIDNDGRDEEIVVDYHKKTGKFLSVRYNWYDDLHRPYRIANYFNVEGIWPGIGVCKQVEQFQREATTIHRQRLDNATLANMAMIVLRKGGTQYGPGEPVFPGKMWFMDDVSDIKELKLSEIYPSSIVNEQAVMSLSDRRSGVNDVILGLPSEGTPETATSDVQKLAESNKRFDLVLKNIKRWLSDIGIDVITNYQIFGDQQVHWFVLDEDGAFVDQVLAMPNILVRRGAIIDLSVTDSVTNRDIEKAQWLQIFQVLTNYYRSVFELSQVLGDPNLVAALGQKALAGSDHVMRRLLETFNITDTDDFTLSEKTPNENQGLAASPTGVGGLAPGLNGGGVAGTNRIGAQ